MFDMKEKIHIAFAGYLTKHGQYPTFLAMNDLDYDDLCYHSELPKSERIITYYGATIITSAKIERGMVACFTPINLTN